MYLECRERMKDEGAERMSEEWGWVTCFSTNSSVDPKDTFYLQKVPLFFTRALPTTYIQRQLAPAPTCSCPSYYDDDRQTSLCVDLCRPLKLVTWFFDQHQVFRFYIVKASSYYHSHLLAPTRTRSHLLAPNSQHLPFTEIKMRARGPDPQAEITAITCCEGKGKVG